VFPLDSQHDAVLACNRFYAGVTRGKRLVVLVGQRKPSAMEVRNVGVRRRWAKLRDFVHRWLAHRSILSRWGASGKPRGGYINAFVHHADDPVEEN